MKNAARKNTPPSTSLPETPTVTAVDLMEVLMYRRKVKDLAEQQRTQVALLAEAETRVTNLLKAGARVDDPEHDACVMKEEGSITPKWKEEHLLHMEAEHKASRVAVEAEVRARYQPATHEELVITDKVRP